MVKNQTVRVDLDAKVDWEADRIECRVQTIQGPVATLSPIEKIGAELAERLISGSLCFMTFNHHGAPVALRGVALAVADSDFLEFVVVDGIQVAERRTAERTPLVTAVKVTSVDSEGALTDPVSTVTSNLSMGGALLLRRPNMGEGPRWQVELFLPGESVHVRCEAILARATPTHFGVKFLNMPEPDQLRVAGLLAGLRRATPVAV